MFELKKQRVDFKARPYLTFHQEALLMELSTKTNISTKDLLHVAIKLIQNTSRQDLLNYLGRSYEHR